MLLGETVHVLNHSCTSRRRGRNWMMDKSPEAVARGKLDKLLMMHIGKGVKGNHQATVRLIGKPRECAFISAAFSAGASVTENPTMAASAVGGTNSARVSTPVWRSVT